MLTWSRFASACLGVIALGIGTMAGCTASSDAPAPQADGGLVCPTSIADVGKACTVEGKSCPTGYACGAFNQQAQCTCAGGVFACNDSAGEPIPAGATTATCIANGSGNDSRCPSTEVNTDGLKCTVSGLQCRYTGFQCPENPPNQPNIDTCQCVAKPGGGLAYVCEPVLCHPSADASDEGLVAPVDAGHDSGHPDTGSDASIVDAADAG